MSLITILEVSSVQWVLFLVLVSGARATRFPLCMLGHCNSYTYISCFQFPFWALFPTCTFPVDFLAFDLRVTILFSQQSFILGSRAVNLCVLGRHFGVHRCLWQMRSSPALIQGKEIHLNHLCRKLANFNFSFVICSILNLHWQKSFLI